MKLLWKFLKNKHYLPWLELVLTIIVIFVLITILGLSSSDLKDKINISVFLGFIISFVTGKFITIVSTSVSKKFEDANKLTHDYKLLINKYENANLYKFAHESQKSIKFPITVEHQFRDVVIQIKDSQKQFDLPDIINKNMDKIIKAQSHSTIFNQLCIRLHNFTFDTHSNTISLETMRTTYFNSLLTNRALDFDWGNTITIRELFEYGPYISSLSESKLSNHIGYNGFVETDDEYIIFVKRSKAVSIAKNTLGTSVGASLKTKYALNENKSFTVDGFYNSINKEIKDELALSEEITISNKNIIAMYRDLVEGGKPQFLFYYKSNKKFADIEAKFKSKLKDKRKGSIFSKMSSDGKKLIAIKKEDLLKLEAVTLLLDKLVVKRRYRWAKKYSLVPSTSASIALLIEYISQSKQLDQPQSEEEQTSKIKLELQKN